MTDAALTRTGRALRRRLPPHFRRAFFRRRHPAWTHTPKPATPKPRNQPPNPVKPPPTGQPPLKHTKPPAPTHDFRDASNRTVDSGS